MWKFFQNRKFKKFVNGSFQVFSEFAEKRVLSLVKMTLMKQFR